MALLKASTKAIKAAWIRRKRAEAAGAGFCARCYKARPDVGYKVCRPCQSSIGEHRKRRRALATQRAEWQEIIAAHEAAADKAHAHHLFDEAAQHYQEALNVAAIVPGDRQRLVQKLGFVSFFTSDPAAANTWRDRMLDSYLSDTEKAETAVRTLLQIAIQMWIDSKTQESLALCEKAVRIAEAHGTSRLRKVATLHLVVHLCLLGRFDDAAQYLSNLKIEPTDDLTIQTRYYWKKGLIAAMRGSASEAYNYLERSSEYAKDTTDYSFIPGILGDYAVAAIALGDLQRARALYEQLLLIVRRNHMGWYVPQACMDYAHILARMGQYTSAHGYLLEALSSDAHAPTLEVQFVSIGIPIALTLNDETTLKKCIRPAAIDLAFQSGEPARVGPVAAAFARLYAKWDQREKAGKLLHRALDVVTYVDESIDLPLAVAQCGARTDIPAARALLETRMRLPSAHVAQACLLLFDALVAQRTQKREYLQNATEAAERFDRLQWSAYSDLARSLIPLPHSISSAHTLREQPFSDALLTLTERERQVVELVLKGQTNRAIAQQLNIREHTVEKHMGSIMNRLGIRSRHQLVGAVAGQP